MLFKNIVGPEGQKAHRQLGINVGNKAAQRFDLLFVDFGDHEDSVLPKPVFSITADVFSIAQDRLGRGPGQGQVQFIVKRLDIIGNGGGEIQYFATVRPWPA